jgi:hypothetical protein
MRNLLPEEILALEIVRSITNSVKGEASQGINNTAINWQNFKEILSYHDLAPFAYLFLKNTDIKIPQDLHELLKSTYYFSLMHNQRFWSEFLRILGVFTDKGVDLVPIKGTALLEELYEDLPIRPMVDIDLLVRRNDLKKAENIFVGLGYQKELLGLKEQYWLNNQYHISFHGKEIKDLPLVELHWGLDYPRQRRIIYPELWARIREVERGGHKIKLLSPEDNFLSLTLHSRRFGKALGFKSVYDAVLLLKKYGDSFDWDYCFEICRKYQLYATLYFMLCQMEFLSGIDTLEKVLGEFKLSRTKKKKIQDFIHNNSFTTDVSSGKKLYLESHFLLYDSIWEPINYILNIPKEQFAKYYCLSSYTKKADFFYHFRFLYIPLRLVSNLFRRDSFKIGQREQSNLGSDTYLFEATGYSMWPFLVPGDKIIAKIIAIDNLKSGDIILHNEEGQVICHRLIKKTKIDDKYSLYVRGDNSCSIERIPQKDYCGKVIGVLRKNRMISLSGPGSHMIGRIIVFFAPCVSYGMRIIKSIAKNIKGG